MVPGDFRCRMRRRKRRKTLQRTPCNTQPSVTSELTTSRISIRNSHHVVHHCVSPCTLEALPILFDSAMCSWKRFLWLFNIYGPWYAKSTEAIQVDVFGRNRRRQRVYMFQAKIRAFQGPFFVEPAGVVDHMLAQVAAQSTAAGHSGSGLTGGASDLDVLLARWTKACVASRVSAALLALHCNHHQSP